MMSLLTNPYFIIPTFALLIQIIVLAMLVYGYWLYTKLKFKQHGKIMAWAVVLHLIVIFVIMIPSFVIAVIPEYVVPHFYGVVSIITLIHVPLGIIAVSFGAWFSIAWGIQGLKGCFNRKKFMLSTMIIWITSLSFGIALYTIFYWSLLMG
jgi:uncharacterized membrane protein YozB (DUF420 family)